MYPALAALALSAAPYPSRASIYPPRGSPPSYSTKAAEDTHDNIEVVNVSPTAGSRNEDVEVANEYEQDDDANSPPTRLFVRSQKIPSGLQRLVGLSLANAPLPWTGKAPKQQSRRYKVIFPLDYSDVEMYPRSGWSDVSSLPEHYVKLFRPCSRYEVEPVLILEAVAQSSLCLTGSANIPGTANPTIQAVQTASWYQQEVCALVEKEIGRRAKFMEKAEGKVDDMVGGASDRSKSTVRKWDRQVGKLITRCEATEGVATAEHFLRRVEQYLLFIGTLHLCCGVVNRLREMLKVMKTRLSRLVQKHKKFVKWV